MQKLTLIRKRVQLSGSLESCSLIWDEGAFSKENGLKFGFCSGSQQGAELYEAGNQSKSFSAEATC